jgi:hypothetical protein
MLEQITQQYRGSPPKDYDTGNDDKQLLID